LPNPISPVTLVIASMAIEVNSFNWSLIWFTFDHVLLDSLEKLLSFILLFMLLTSFLSSFLVERVR